MVWIGGGAPMNEAHQMYDDLLSDPGPRTVCRQPGTPFLSLAASSCHSPTGVVYTGVAGCLA